MNSGVRAGVPSLLQERYALVAALLAAGGSLLVYWSTTAFAAGFHDSAELALRASQLGATHATGAPLHTLTGYVLNLLTANPAIATALISMVAACISAALVSWLASTVVASFWPALAGGLSYALLYPVWTNAVTIELYSFSVLLVAAAVCAGRVWGQKHEPGFPLVMTLLYGLSLAAHFANILLLPAFLWLVGYSTGWQLRRLGAFLLLILGFIVLTALANMALAARVPPFGEFTPTSFEGLFAYMSGKEHNPLAARSFAELSLRVIEHLRMLAEQFVYAGLVVALAGLWTIVRANAGFGIFLLLLLGANFGYFTLFGSGDYFMMVGPSYLVLSISLVAGAHALARAFGAQNTLLSACIPAVLAVVFLVSQYQVRRAEASSTFVADYTSDAFRALPMNAIAIARWNEFTALRYFQVLAGERVDLTLIVPARRLRHYAHGDVKDYLLFVAANICSRPVVTNKLSDELLMRYQVQSVPGTDNWKQLLADASLCGAIDGSGSTP